VSLDLTGRKSYGDQDREMEGRAMPARVSFAEIAAGLIVPERVLLFCLASNTDWQRAGVTQVCAQQMMIRGLVDRQGSSYVLTAHR
jgi:hypothetical protein